MQKQRNARTRYEKKRFNSSELMGLVLEILSLGGFGHACVSCPALGENIKYFASLQSCTHYGLHIFSW